MGRVLSNQFLGRFGRSLEHDSASFTRGKNPIGVATKGVIESRSQGGRPRLLYAHTSTFVLITIDFQLRLNLSLLY